MEDSMLIDVIVLNACLRAWENGYDVFTQFKDCELASDLIDHEPSLEKHDIEEVETCVIDLRSRWTEVINEYNLKDCEK